ncbi:MAG: hypothetical protein LQ339_002725 [Xanthoria mediterranea]|nr:MAG: hypothetical protein LQ339_002725 [Xanthoria mediterranea]
MPSKTIQIIGSLNIDLITRTPRHPSPGETLTATSFTYGPGGKGANQAVACARLSRSKNNQQQQQQQQAASPSPSTSSSSTPTINIQMIGAVGKDFFGHHLLSELKANGVDTTRVQQREDDGQKTGTAVVIVEEDSGENRILITPGANASVVSPPSLIIPPSSSSSPSMTSLPDLIILQLEIPLATVVSIIATARETGIDVLLNPAPAVGDLPTSVYGGLKHLIMNESEAGILMQALGGEREEVERGNPKNTQDICERFHALGVTNVIITLGAKGVYYSFRNEAEGWGEGGHVPAAEVETVVDTTAAGDAFVGAYAVAVVGHGVGVPDAVRWANGVGARTVEKEGAMGAIPWGDEVGWIGG